MVGSYKKTEVGVVLSTGSQEVLKTAISIQCVKVQRTCENIVNKSNWLTVFFIVYFCQSVHVLSCYGLIIRRYICVYAVLGTCCSVWMTVWYAEWDFHCTLYTTQSSIQSKYQVLHKHSCIS